MKIDYNLLDFQTNYQSPSKKFSDGDLSYGDGLIGITILRVIPKTLFVPQLNPKHNPIEPKKKSQNYTQNKNIKKSKNKKSSKWKLPVYMNEP